MTKWIKTDAEELIKFDQIYKINYIKQPKKDGIYAPPSYLLKFNYPRVVCYWYDFYVSFTEKSEDQSCRILMLSLPVALSQIVFYDFLNAFYMQLSKENEQIFDCEIVAEDILKTLVSGIDLNPIIEKEKYYCEVYDGKCTRTHQTFPRID